LIALNVLYYSNDAKKKVYDNIKAVQGVTKKAIFEAQESNNRVFLLSTSKDAAKTDLNQVPENVAALEAVVKDFDASKALWMKDLDMAEHVKAIKEIF
jgi:phage shock protein A